MKKKLMLVAALFGALTLGACVDDNESASVTTVREAKAEQLKAAAALANAQAQAEIIKANAEAALKAAEAEYQKALAAAKNAETEQIAELTRQAQEKFALEIAKLQAETDKAIAEAKKAIAEAEQSAANTNDARINSLYSAYSDALDELVDLNEQLVETKASIAYLEAGVEYAKAYAKTRVTYYERNIAGLEAQIAVLKDPAYTNVNSTEMYAQAQAAEKKASLAWADFRSKEGASVKEAGDAVKAAYEALDLEAVDKLNSMYYVVETTTDYSTFLYYVNDIYGNISYLGDWLLKSIRINETNKLYADRYYAGEVETWAATLGTDKDTKDKNTAWGQLAAANDQLATANKMAESTDAEKADKAAAVKAAEETVAAAKDYLAYVQNEYDNKVKAQKEYTDALAALPAVEEAIAAFAAAWEAQEKAIEAYNDAFETPNKLAAEAEALWDLYYNATDVEEQIAGLEADIANAKKWLEYYSAEGEYITNAEKALATANQEIVNLEALIEAQTKIADAAKAALDAALAE